MIEPEVLRYFRLLRIYGLNHATSGNASNRKGITPTGCCADNLEELRLVSFDSEEKSQDALIHKACYAERKDIHAILHAHPPYAIACAGHMGSPGTQVIDANWETEKRKIGKALAKHGLVIHAGHGVYSAAATARDAYIAICELEHVSQIIYLRG